MKISSPKPPQAARPAEPPGKSGNAGIVPPKGTNTGIVPPKGTNTGIVVPPKGTNTGIVPPGATQPEDGFQPTTGTGGKGGTSAASGTSSASLVPSTPSDYALSPNLEPYRGLFDSEGERISKLPLEQQRGEIESTSTRLWLQLKDVASREEVNVGLKGSVEFYSRGSGGNDPMVFARANVSADTLGGGSVSGGGSVGIGTSPKPSAPSNDQGSLPSTGRQDRTEEQTHQRFRRMRHHF
jgi:hypothetical protein